MFADEGGNTEQKMLLPEELDIRAAGPLAAEILARRGVDLEVDASGVLKFGAQCLQVILSARLTWQNDGRRFTVTAASSEFVDAAALLGASFLLPPCEA